MTTCRIEDCGRSAIGRGNYGVPMCARCLRTHASIGEGAVYFAGRWHGVWGAYYTAAQVAAAPGLRVAPEAN